MAVAGRARRKLLPSSATLRSAEADDEARVDVGLAVLGSGHLKRILQGLTRMSRHVCIYIYMHIDLIMFIFALTCIYIYILNSLHAHVCLHVRMYTHAHLGCICLCIDLHSSSRQLSCCIIIHTCLFVYVYLHNHDCVGICTSMYTGHTGSSGSQKELSWPPTATGLWSARAVFGAFASPLDGLEAGRGVLNWLATCNNRLSHNNMEPHEGPFKEDCIL